ncbi:hypothetical protein [Rathayibacter sp. VKM Ac-2760]|uniref:hypothetical protein n=1 Tax=Rathayibacter sp. VKM Ac-2760 TaxID=2609253 RepID=UPI0013194E5D|nr:hypothetical protein [Rathayibacter sp. VKM Ac-2760]QHC57528.1 hypothetical protein GSU72_02215 [Rathayibacter sp. VKM Ac-2760]
MADAQQSWDSTAIVVVPGIPGTLTQPAGSQDVYPASTLPFFKVLRAAGYPVRMERAEDVREISHHAADVWLPIVAFGIQVLAGGAGNVLADVLMLFFDAIPARKTSVHISWRVEGSDGTTQHFQFDGDSAKAIDAARAFERSLGYGRHDE